MRLSRWLILAALLAIVVFVGQTYIKRQQALARAKPAPPAPLEIGIEGRASDWVYTQSDGEHPRVTVRAKSFRQVKAPSVMELNGVELQLFHKDGDKFDLVRSEKAQFDIAAKTLYSDGDVVITMGKPADGAIPSARSARPSRTSMVLEREPTLRRRRDLSRPRLGRIERGLLLL